MDTMLQEIETLKASLKEDQLQILALQALEFPRIEGTSLRTLSPEVNLFIEKANEVKSAQVQLFERLVTSTQALARLVEKNFSNFAAIGPLAEKLATLEAEIENFKLSAEEKKTSDGLAHPPSSSLPAPTFIEELQTGLHDLTVKVDKNVRVTKALNSQNFTFTRERRNARWVATVIVRQYSAVLVQKPMPRGFIERQ